MKGAVKSVRFTPEVEAFINSYKGSDFTAKLTNIILNQMQLEQEQGYHELLQQQKASLCELQEHYDHLREKYAVIRREISVMDSIFQIDVDKS